MRLFTMAKLLLISGLASSRPRPVPSWIYSHVPTYSEESPHRSIPQASIPLVWIKHAAARGPDGIE